MSCLTVLASARATSCSTSPTPWAGWSTSGAKTPRSSGRNGGWIRMANSSRKAPSNSQRSRYGGFSFLTQTPLQSCSCRRTIMFTTTSFCMRLSTGWSEDMPGKGVRVPADEDLRGRAPPLLRVPAARRREGDRQLPDHDHAPHRRGSASDSDGEMTSPRWPAVGTLAAGALQLRERQVLDSLGHMQRNENEQ